MMTDEEEQRALLAEISDAGYRAAEGCDARCADCDRATDGEVQRDGLCDACWRERERWRCRPDSERLPRVVELGHSYEAQFEFYPERALWIYSAKVSEPMRLPVFLMPDGFTDAELAKRLRVWVTFS